VRPHYSTKPQVVSHRSAVGAVPLQAHSRVGSTLASPWNSLCIVPHVPVTLW